MVKASNDFFRYVFNVFSLYIFRRLFDVFRCYFISNKSPFSILSCSMLRRLEFSSIRCCDAFDVMSFDVQSCTLIRRRIIRLQCLPLLCSYDFLPITRARIETGQTGLTPRLTLVFALRGHFHTHETFIVN